jgi:two-component system, chemotaxis family, protein-glutamate methylesterase/glutaminase
VTGPSPPAISVMLCDDSATVRNALARLLETDPAIRVTLRAANGAEAVSTLAGLPAAARPQIVLLDLEMPVMDGMTRRRVRR